MKRLIALAMMLTVLVSSLFAAEHLSFMGTQVDGTVASFCKKLVNQKGLTIEKRNTDNGVYSLSGKYNGMANCEFYVFPNDNGQVYAIDVYLPKNNTWSALKNQYKRIVRDFRSNSSFRFDEEAAEFESPYREGDGDEIQAVDDGKCNYYTDFITDGGWVRIKISEYRQIELSYYDFANFPSQDSDDTTSSNVSNSGKGMTFMGLEMRGNFKSFARQLVNQKNCTIVEEGDLYVQLSGQFTGKESEIYVFGTDITKQVWKVVVYLPKASTWSEIKREYLSYKSAYDNKYTVDSSYDFFSDPYNEGDGDEVEGVRAEKCYYVTFYNAAGGTVMLKISKYMQVQMSYEDSENTALKEREEDNDNSGSNRRSMNDDI